MLRLARKLPVFLIVVALAAALAAIFGLVDHAVSFAAVGTGAAYLKNLPAPNTYVIDPVTFATFGGLANATFTESLLASVKYARSMSGIEI